MSALIRYISIDIGATGYTIALLNSSCEVTELISSIEPLKTQEEKTNAITRTLHDKIHSKTLHIEKTILTLSDRLIREKIISLTLLLTDSFINNLKSKLNTTYEVNFDTQIISYRILSERRNDKGNLDYIISVLIIPKNIFYKYKVWIEKSGGTKIELSTRSIALSTFYYQNGLGHHGKTTALLSISYDTTELLIVKDKTMLFQRSIPFGLELLEKELTFAPLSPNQVKVYLTNQLDLINPSGTREDELSLMIMNTFVNELKRAIQSFITDFHGLHIEQMVLFGQGAVLGKMDKYLSQELELPVTIVQAASPNALHQLNLLVEQPIDFPQCAEVIGLAICLKKNIRMLNIKDYKPELRHPILSTLQKTTFALTGHGKGIAVAAICLLLSITILFQTYSEKYSEQQRRVIRSLNQELQQIIQPTKKEESSSARNSYPILFTNIQKSQKSIHILNELLTEISTLSTNAQIHSLTWINVNRSIILQAHMIGTTNKKSIITKLQKSKSFKARIKTLANTSESTHANNVNIEVQHLEK